jgi:hypothetical protein
MVRDPVCTPPLTFRKPRLAGAGRICALASAAAAAAMSATSISLFAVFIIEIRSSSRTKRPGASW